MPRSFEFPAIGGPSTTINIPDWLQYGPRGIPLDPGLMGPPVPQDLVALPAQQQPNPALAPPPEPPPPRYVNDQLLAKYTNAFVGPPAPQAAPTPDQALSIFTNGGRADSAAQIAASTPTWGGVDFGGNTALTAGQMEQDLRARDLINARYAQGMRDIAAREAATDPLRRQIDATKNLRELERLLPAEQRPLKTRIINTPDGPQVVEGAFAQDESGTYRNIPDTGPTQGDLERQLYDPKLAEFRRGQQTQNLQQLEIGRLNKTLKDIDDRMRQDLVANPELAPEIRQDAAEAKRQATLLSSMTLQSLVGGETFSGFVPRPPRSDVP